MFKCTRCHYVMDLCPDCVKECPECSTEVCLGCRGKCTQCHRVLCTICERVCARCEYKILPCKKCYKNHEWCKNCLYLHQKEIQDSSDLPNVLVNLIVQYLECPLGL